MISEEPCNPVKSILKRNSICTDSEISDESKSDQESVESNKEESEISIGIFDEGTHNLINDKMMMLKRHQQKRKKGVTFSPEPVKPTVNNSDNKAESSEDELNGYDKVVVSQNLGMFSHKMSMYSPVSCITFKIGRFYISS